MTRLGVDNEESYAWGEPDDVSPIGQAFGQDTQLQEFGKNVAGDVWEIVSGMSDLMKAAMLDVPTQVINRFRSYGQGEAGEAYRQAQADAATESFKAMGKGALKSVTDLASAEAWFENPVHNALTAYFLLQAGRQGASQSAKLFNKIYYKKLPKGLVKDFKQIQVMHEFGSEYLAGRKVPKHAEAVLKKMDPKAIDAYNRLVNKTSAAKARKFEYERGVEPRFKRTVAPEPEAPVETTVMEQPATLPRVVPAETVGGVATTTEYSPAIRINKMAYTGETYTAAFENLPAALQGKMGQAELGYVTKDGVFVSDVQLAGAQEKGMTPKVVAPKKKMKLPTVKPDTKGQGYKVTFFDPIEKRVIGREGEFVGESDNYYAFLDAQGRAFTVYKGGLQSTKLSDMKSPPTKPIQKTELPGVTDYSMTAQDAAATLKISKRKLGELIRNKTIAATREGKSYKIMRSEIDRFMGVEPAPEPVKLEAAADYAPEPSPAELEKAKKRWVVEAPTIEAPAEVAPEVATKVEIEVPTELAKDPILSDLYKAYTAVEKVRGDLKAQGNTKEAAQWDKDRKAILTGLHKRWAELGGTLNELAAVVKGARKTPAKAKVTAEETIDKITAGEKSVPPTERAGTGKKADVLRKAETRLSELDTMIETATISGAEHSEIARLVKERNDLRSRFLKGKGGKGVGTDEAISISKQIRLDYRSERAKFGVGVMTLDDLQHMVPKIKRHILPQVSSENRKILSKSDWYLYPNKRGSSLHRSGYPLRSNVVEQLMDLGKLSEHAQELEGGGWLIYKPFVIIGQDAASVPHEAIHVLQITDESWTGLGERAYRALRPFWEPHTEPWLHSYANRGGGIDNFRPEPDSPYPANDHMMRRIFKEVAAELGSENSLRQYVGKSAAKAMLSNLDMRDVLMEIDVKLHGRPKNANLGRTLQTIVDIAMEGEAPANKAQVIKSLRQLHANYLLRRHNLVTDVGVEGAGEELSRPEDVVVHGTDSLENVAGIIEEGLRGGHAGAQGAGYPFVLEYKRSDFRNLREVAHRPGDYIHSGTKEGVRPLRIIINTDDIAEVESVDDLMEKQEALMKEILGDRADTMSGEEMYDELMKNSKWKALDRRLDHAYDMKEMGYKPRTVDDLLRRAKSLAQEYGIPIHRGTWNEETESLGMGEELSRPVDPKETAVFEWMQKHGEAPFELDYGQNKILVTPSAKHPGSWQATHIVWNTPWGDITSNSYREMLFRLISKYDVDLSKAKVRKTEIRKDAIPKDGFVHGAPNSTLEEYLSNGIPWDAPGESRGTKFVARLDHPMGYKASMTAVGGFGPRNKGTEAVEAVVGVGRERSYEDPVAYILKRDIPVATIDKQEAIMEYVDAHPKMQELRKKKTIPGTKRIEYTIDELKQVHKEIRPDVEKAVGDLKDLPKSHVAQAELIGIPELGDMLATPDQIIGIIYDGPLTRVVQAFLTTGRTVPVYSSEGQLRLSADRAKKALK